MDFAEAMRVWANTCRKHKHCEECPLQIECGDNEPHEWTDEFIGNLVESLYLLSAIGGNDEEEE